jgi:hypothetical protein
MFCVPFNNLTVLTGLAMLMESAHRKGTVSASICKEISLQKEILAFARKCARK